jgi:hypothetical protein
MRCLASALRRYCGHVSEGMVMVFTYISYVSSEDASRRRLKDGGACSSLFPHAQVQVHIQPIVQGTTSNLNNTNSTT